MHKKAYKFKNMYNNIKIYIKKYKNNKNYSKIIEKN